MRLAIELRRCAAIMALAVPLTAAAAAAQQNAYTIRGHVLDATTGQGLAGAQILIQGTNFGALTDNTGTYTLNASLPQGRYTVEASFVGRATQRQEITLGAQRTVELAPVSLEMTVLALDELVATGTAGPTSRRALGNSVSVVEAREVAESPATTLDAALAGKVAGAVITSNTGTPGGGVSVRLRGTSSIIGGAEPLYIVDGVIVDNNSDQQINFGYRSNPSNRLADLDPNDIERVEILKGAAAAALYGSRANNGVVQIFTKRGRLGEARITAATRISRDVLPKRLDFAMTPVDEDGNPVVRYDHQDLLFRDAVSNDSYVAVSGGTEATKYYLSANFVDQQGIMKASDHRKINVRLNLDQNLSDRFQISGGANYIRSKTNLLINGEAGQGGLLTAIVFTPTTVNLAERDPETGKYVNSAFVFPNPLVVIDDWSMPQEVNRFIGSFQAKANPVDNFNVEYRLGYDSYQLETSLFKPRGSPEAGAPLGSSITTVRQTYLINNDIITNYLWAPSNGIALTTSAGFNQSYTNAESLNLGASDLSLLTELVRGAVQSASQSRVETTTLGFFGQQQVALNDRLFLTGALRWDASSTFGADERWQLYPKLSGSWVVSDESFWSDSRLGSLLPEFRVRAALGYAGNQPPTGYAYARIPRYGQSTNIDRLGLVHLGDAGNPSLKPERQREYEVGFETSLADARVGASLTYYNQYTTDLLLTRPFAPSSGYNGVLDNVGELSNKGLEIQLNTVNLDRPNFRWSSTLIYSRNKNTVEKLYGDPFTVGYNNRVEEGQPIGAFWDYGFMRDASGAIVYENGNTNMPVRDSVKSIIGNPWPDFTASLRNDLRIGDRLSASFLLDGSFGQEVWNQTRRIMDIFDAGPLYDRQLRGEITAAELTAHTRIPEAYLEDASYIKLREASIRYSIDPAVAGRLGLAGIDLELIGRNLLTFTDYTGYDPEVNMFGTNTVERGVDFAVYPNARSMSFGLRVNY